MKRFFVAWTMVLLSISMNGQLLTKDDYLQKSKNRKTFAWILTAGGGAMVIGGLTLIAADPDYVDSKTIGGTIAGVGAAAIVGGIILFSSARENEQKANGMAIQVHVKIENALTYQGIRQVSNYYPALALHIGLK
jgi:hypothetical protein